MAKKKDTMSSVEKTLDNVAIISGHLDKVDTLLTNNKKAVYALVILAAGLYVYTNERNIYFDLFKFKNKNEEERENYDNEFKDCR